ncbi:MAG: EF-hand domain-containing protein [Gammaproteobacteria bacterium]|nr:EF-hand domain-containing protein [Gammaproteobacteria bacterium]
MKRTMQAFEKPKKNIGSVMGALALMGVFAGFVVAASDDSHRGENLLLPDPSDEPDEQAKNKESNVDLEALETLGEVSSLLLEIPENLLMLRSGEDLLRIRDDGESTTLQVDRKSSLLNPDPELVAFDRAKKLILTNLSEEINELVMTKSKLTDVVLEIPPRLDTKRIFDAMDSDNDGSLSQQEFATGTRHPPNAATHFARVDSDGDGALSNNGFVDGLESETTTTAEKGSL